MLYAQAGSTIIMMRIAIEIADVLRREARQVGLIECKHEPAAGIVESRRMIAVSDVRDEVVVVRDKQSVLVRAGHADIRTEGDPFQLGGNVRDCETGIAQHGGDIQEECLADGLGSEVGSTADPTYILCAVQV